jgi:carbonic anhydrase/acetyltransferase-like protein (isoleucine patch superfamily)
MPIVEVAKRMPRIHPTALVLEPATVAGDVEIGPDSSIWFGAVLRGDVNSIRIGSRSNVQDLCVVHVTGGTGPVVIEDDVTIGHNAVIHGCHVGSRVLIGMGAVILDQAVIGSDSLVAAGAVVPSRMVIPPGVLVMGAPARVKRELTDDEKRGILDSATHYVEMREMYR